MKCYFEANEICNLCLKVDEKVYRLDNSHHKTFIESIIKLKESNYVPTDDLYLCQICYILLSKTYHFVQTIWNAQEIINDMSLNTNMITKQMLNHIDRHKKGLNPITLTSVVISVNEWNDEIISNINTKTEIEEVEFDFLDKILNGKTEQTKETERQIEEHEVVTKLEIEKGIERQTEKVEIYNKLEIETILIDSDPLTTDLNMEACDKPKAKTKKITKNKVGLNVKPLSSSIEKQLITIKSKALWSSKKFNQPPASVDDGWLSSSEKSCSSKNKRKRKKSDDDYNPGSMSESEDSDDSYDFQGKLKNPKDDRVYPRQCDHCNFEVLKKLDHYHHYLDAHPNVEYPYKIERNYTCTICGKLETKHKIKGHEKSHTLQHFKCTVCPKVFATRKRWYNHLIRVHTEKTYTCDYCSKTIKTKSDLRRHIRTHTGSKPFKCHICGDGFAHSGNRLVHIRSKHQNYKYVPKKNKQTQKARKNYNHDSTDTEISYSDKTKQRRTKNTKTKPLRKRNNLSGSSEVTMKKKRKTKQSSKNEKNDCSDTAMTVASENVKPNYKRKKRSQVSNFIDTDINIDQQNINHDNAEIESEDESLAVIMKKKCT